MTKPASSATINPTVSLFTAMTACWPMLEGSGTTSSDKSGHGHTLTFAGGGTAPTWTTNGSGEAMIAIGTALSAPLAVTSPITLGPSADWSIAFRAKQTSSGTAGMVLGDNSNTNDFVWLAGGSYFGVRSHATVDANATSLTTFTSDANYLITYDQSGGYIHIFKDGSEVSGSPFAVGTTFQLTINTLGNGYTSTTFGLVGALTYCYVWSGYEATSADATALHADPYHGLTTSPVIGVEPTRGEPSRSITVHVTGYLTTWLSQSTSGLFTVSGGTGASISNIAVQSDTAATFTLQPGTATGTLTITDTSSSATTSFTVAAQNAGGILSSTFTADSSVSGSDASGRTFIGLMGSQRIRQHGPITQVSAYVSTIDGSNGWRFKVFRPNGTNFDYVSQSELITPGGTGVQTFNLATPMSCQPGDLVGVWLQNGNAVGVKTASLTPAIKYEGGNQVGTNWNPASSLNDFSLDIEFRSAFVTMIAVGDSRDAGHNGATSYLTWYESGGIGPASALAAQPIHQLQALIDATRTTCTYQNFAKGSQTWAFLAATAFPDIFTNYRLTPTRLHIQCGVNDVAAGRSNAAVQADMDTCYALVPSSCRIYLDLIQPWTAGNDTQAAALRSMNSMYVSWAVGKSNVTIVSAHDAMGQTRVSTGQLDDMATSYDYDGVHMTVPAGVDKLAALRFAALSTGGVLLIGGLTKSALIYSRLQA